MSELEHAASTLQRMAQAFAKGQVNEHNLQCAALLYSAERLDEAGDVAAANALTKHINAEALR